VRTTRAWGRRAANIAKWFHLPHFLHDLPQAGQAFLSCCMPPQPWQESEALPWLEVACGFEAGTRTCSPAARLPGIPAKLWALGQTACIDDAASGTCIACNWELTVSRVRPYQSSSSSVTAPSPSPFSSSFSSTHFSIFWDLISLYTSRKAQCLAKSSKRA